MKTITLNTSVSNDATARSLSVDLNIPETVEELVSRMGDAQTAIDFFTRGLKISAQSIVRTQLKKDVTDKVILAGWSPDFIPPTRKPADKATKVKKLMVGMSKAEMLALIETMDD